MKPIVLDYKKDVELFNKTAQECAQDIGENVKNTQIRNFYDQVLKLYEQSKRLKDEEFVTDLLPFVKMLNSKVAYAKTRTSSGKPLINNEFAQMMNSCINQVKNKNDLQTFKLFFESVIGFHKGIAK